MGLHSAPPTRSRWRRKFLGLPVVAWLVIAVAGAAIAALFAFARTAPDDFTVQAEGNLAAGFVTDVDQLFGDQVLEPGVPISSCVTFTTGDGTAIEQARIFASDYVDNNLGSAINFTIEGDTAAGANGIDPTCAQWDGTFVGVYSGTLDGFATTATDWDSAGPGPFTQTTTTSQMWIARFTLELDAAAAASTVDPADTTQVGFTFEARNAP